MIEEQPVASTPPAEKEPEQATFWGYTDLFLVAGLAFPCLFLGFALVRVAMWILRLHTTAAGIQAVPAMVIGYALLFAAVAAILRLQYGRPFWRSLGWTESRLPLLWCAICGIGTSITVAAIGKLLRTPDTSGPLIDMMKDPRTLILLAIFGTTAAPLFEELAFRGFLQPLLVRSLGAVMGIGLAAALFGALHFSEYGNSWRSALLVGLSGVAFGCIRHFTGSTKASVIAHAAFNALPFMFMFAQR
jgi:membrane protease YdiL (CAAX protease family)